MDKEGWGKQDGNMCNPCIMAGRVRTDWRNDGVPLTEERKKRLVALHELCPGHSRCFCQHRVIDGE